MNKSKGFGYCGKPCCLCTVSKCQGCKAEGDFDHSNCENYRCAINRELKYCHQCVDFPCEKGTMCETVSQGMSKFLQMFTEDETLSYLEKNERNGMLYHYLHTLQGDYHQAKTPEKVMELILKGSDTNLLD